MCVKGLVHPKMKILSVFTHPQVVLKHSSIHNFLLFSRTNKHIEVWNNLRVSKY